MMTTKSVALVTVAATTLVLSTALLAVQQPPAGGTPPASGVQPPQGSGQGGGGRQGTQPLDLADRTGFQSIFDGSMKNWDGDPSLWKAENGMLVGETTAANALKENSFVIWRGGEPADFELKVELRMSATNSGIQFRSQHLPPGTVAGDSTVVGKWVLKGYQADIDFNNRFSGMFYEEKGRGFLMQRGQVVHIAADGSKRVIGNLERNADELKALIKPGDWNNVHLIARGNTLINIVNGHVMAVVIDDDPKGRSMKGLLGFQIHTGPPMRIEFRNLYLKTL